MKYKNDSTKPLIDPQDFEDLLFELKKAVYNIFVFYNFRPDTPQFNIQINHIPLNTCIQDIASITNELIERAKSDPASREYAFLAVKEFILLSVKQNAHEMRPPVSSIQDLAISSLAKIIPQDPYGVYTKRVHDLLDKLEDNSLKERVTNAAQGQESILKPASTATPEFQEDNKLQEKIQQHYKSLGMGDDEDKKNDIYARIKEFVIHNDIGAKNPGAINDSPLCILDEETEIDPFLLEKILGFAAEIEDKIALNQKKILESEDIDKRELKSEANSIKNNPYKRHFYDTLVRELNGTYTASISVNGIFDIIQSSMTGNIGFLGEFLICFGDLVPTFGGAVKFVGLVLKKLDQIQQDRMINNLREITNSTVDMNMIAMNIGRVLAGDEFRKDSLQSKKTLMEKITAVLRDLTNNLPTTSSIDIESILKEMGLAEAEQKLGDVIADCLEKTLCFLPASPAEKKPESIQDIEIKRQKTLGKEHGIIIAEIIIARIFSGALDYIDSPNKNVEVIEELVAFVFKQFDQGKNYDIERLKIFEINAGHSTSSRVEIQKEGTTEGDIMSKTSTEKQIASIVTSEIGTPITMSISSVASKIEHVASKIENSLAIELQTRRDQIFYSKKYHKLSDHLNASSEFKAMFTQKLKEKVAHSAESKIRKLNHLIRAVEDSEPFKALIRAVEDANQKISYSEFASKMVAEAEAEIKKEASTHSYKIDDRSGSGYLEFPPDPHQTQLAPYDPEFAHRQLSGSNDHNNDDCNIS
ncbi:MAG: hypothetical protein SFT91_02930 [Rickettsiaceae bacterium]|nr:hypothetical protein [Rickettsiaceae bacterium]